MTFSERLKQAMDQAPGGPIKQIELARKVGVSKSSVSQWIHGDTKSLNARNLYKVADVLGVAPEWLMDNRGNMRDHLATQEAPADYTANSEASPGAHGYTMVPRYDVGVSAGHGNHVEHEEVDHELAFRTDWLKRRDLSIKHLCVIHAQGESMAPRIGSGDILLVDRSQTQVRDGKVYALRMGDDTRVKRLFWQADGSLLITSDNPSPEYRDQTVPAGQLEHVHIIGRVVWAGVEL